VNLIPSSDPLAIAFGLFLTAEAAW
jgi:hypothetical protein